MGHHRSAGPMLVVATLGAALFGVAAAGAAWADSSALVSGLDVSAAAQ
jgi:hypothetical protein